jgi:hypothetical protein
MTSANLTQTLLNKLQILPIQRQQQLLDGLEDEDLLTNISPPELQALANISLAPAPQTQLSDLPARNADGKALRRAMTSGRSLTIAPWFFSSCWALIMGCVFCWRNWRRVMSRSAQCSWGMDSISWIRVLSFSVLDRGGCVMGA